MGEQEHRSADDEFTVEFTDLGQQDSTNTTEHSPLISSSYSLKHPRLTRNQRRLQLLFTVSIVLLTLLIILGSTAQVRNLVAGIIVHPVPTPTPTPTLAAGVDLFYIEQNPDWGKISIDGRALTHLPVVETEAPLKFTRGVHTLVWYAEPFKTMVCTFSVPASYEKDTCSKHEVVMIKAGEFAWIIKLSMTLLMLPEAQQYSVASAIQRSLDSRRMSEIVQTGEHYALYSDSFQNQCKTTSRVSLCYATAVQPILGTLGFQLDSPVSPRLPNTIIGSFFADGQDCRTFCSSLDMYFPTVFPAQEWNIYVVIHSFWQYTTLDGQNIAQYQPDSFVGGMVNNYLVPVHVTWGSTGWHVAELFSNSQWAFADPVCDAASSDAAATDLYNLVINQARMNIFSQTSSDLQTMPDCVMKLTIQQGDNFNPTPDPSAPPPQVAYVLHRFGVLLAVNDLAHQLYPSLPVADNYEKGVALELLSHTLQ